MDRESAARQTILCVAVAAFVAIVAGIGVFARGGGHTRVVESVRGEQYELVTSGVYAFNAQRVVAEGIGWDVFTLFFAVPALLACTPWLWRGALRARFFALGLLGYVFYQYLMYAMTWAFGPLFLPFVGIYALSGIAIVLIAASVAREPNLGARFTEGFPRRGMAALSIVLGTVLVVMWLGRVATALRGDLGGGMLLGQTTMVVQGLDLGLIVPLSGITAWTVLRRQAAGYVLASVLAVKAVAMAAAICAMLIGVWRMGGGFEVAPFMLFGTAALIATALGVKMFRSIEEAPP